MRSLLLAFAVAIALALALNWPVASAQAQVFRVADEISFHRGTHELSEAHMGGLDNPQFSQLDVDQDGSEDLVIFDRTAQAFYVYRKTDPSTATYVYAPEYSSIFPEVLDWALLVDYNCDGLQDIFTYFSGAIQVYTAGVDAGEISFTKLTDRLRYGPSSTPVPSSRVDLPAIGDVDNDGDLDILTFGSLGGFIRYYQNQSVENGWGCDSLFFDLNSNCWGEFFELSACDGGDLFVSCKGGGFDADAGSRMHAGSTLCLADKDGDNVNDLLVGDLGCNNLVLLRNHGDTAFAQIGAQDYNFPSEDVPVNYAGFHAAFYLDLDGDGNKDIVSAPNDDEYTRNVRQVSFYLNGSSDSLQPVFQTDSFLVEDMVDAGSLSKVVPFDDDGDGLLDLVVGVRYYLASLDTIYGLSLYRNVGTASDPAYELVSRDYQGLSSYAIEYLAPAFGDLDGDGDLDLLLGTGGGDLHLFENTAGAGNPAAFTLSEPNFEGINDGEHATPMLFDLNKDGMLDLVVGERNGNLNYYRNIGSTSDPQYLLETNFWGAVDVRRGPSTIGFSSPWVLTTEIGTMELYAGSLSGYLYRYTNLDGNLLGTFTLEDSSWLGIDVGRYSAITTADINDDGRFDIFLGNVRGGLTIYTEKGTPSIGIPGSGAGAELNLFPNPTTDFVELSWTNLPQGPATMNVLDVTGRLVLQQNLQAHSQAGAQTSSQTTKGRLRLNLQDLSAGIYLVEISGQNFRVAEKLVKH